MLKATGVTGDGRPLCVLGLTKENVAQLVADRPICVDLQQLGLPAVDVVLVYGEDQVEIVANLEANGLAPAGLTQQVKADGFTT